MRLVQGDAKRVYSIWRRADDSVFHSAYIELN